LDATAAAAAARGGGVRRRRGGRNEHVHTIGDLAGKVGGEEAVALKELEEMSGD